MYLGLKDTNLLDFRYNAFLGSSLNVLASLSRHILEAETSPFSHICKLNAHNDNYTFDVGFLSVGCEYD